jgi:hypothetical protein
MKRNQKSIFIVLSFSLLFSICTYAIKKDEGHFKSFSLGSLRNPPKNKFQLIQNISQIKKDDLFKMLRGFVFSAQGSRLVGSSGHELARQFLERTIRVLDSEKKGLLYLDKFKPDTATAITHYETSFQEKVAKNFKKTTETYELGRRFTSSMVNFLKKNKNVEGRNIIWEKRGSVRPNDLLILTAHYDTVIFDDKGNLSLKGPMPGADDNASGVATALAMIKLFSHMDLPITVRVVFLDWEEFGSLGSKAFASKYAPEIKEKNLIGFINLEMLGHDSKVGDKENHLGNMRLYIQRPGTPNHEVHKGFANKLLEKGKKVEKSIRFKIIANSQNLEGDMSFWRPSWPAVSFSQNWQDDPNVKRNHTSNDFPETLNSRTLYYSYRFIAGAISSLAYGF